MSERMDRRSFMKGALLAAGAAKLAAAQSPALGQVPGTQDALPAGKIGQRAFSRLLLGGNLLTHYTHSRDLQYVYTLTAHYNTPEKILETLAVAEASGITGLVIHTADGVVDLLKRYRTERGGKMQWIICPTAPVVPGLEAYTQEVQGLIDAGVDAIYLWGVRADALVAEGKGDLMAAAVEAARQRGVLSGVGAHDLNVIMACERDKVPADFYIKTFHHHNYPTAPKPEELSGPTGEIPGYWCKDPAAVSEFMKGVEKPWIAFKVMAAGAISPTSAFKYAFENGADFVLAGMFDFEIKDDVAVAKGILSRGVDRARPWRS